MRKYVNNVIGENNFKKSLLTQNFWLLQSLEL